ncbi:MAG: hypothetical protein JWR14_4778 [Caballeronia sp.]|jgi:hypothetical protein|nr:hypothetical protein [Caballeronia sp.]
MLKQRKRAPPEGTAVRRLLASPLEATPQPPKPLQRSCRNHSRMREKVTP